MASPFPVPLDNLIAYVKVQRQPDPLAELTAAMVVAERLDEQTDAFIGHFVDQARRSGASWSQIGTSMGVSKQAAQKRFVPRWDGSDQITEGQLFSRFTMRARNVVAMAQAIMAGADVTANALVVALFSEPEGLAAIIMHQLGAAEDKVCEAFELLPVTTRFDADAFALRQIAFAVDAKAVLGGTLKAALRLGHNYIGTEHLLLGVLFANGQAAVKLIELGLTVEAIESRISEAIARIQAERRADKTGV